MNRIYNPFAPGAGNPPPELAGRADVLSELNVALQRVAIGRPAQSSIMVGLRGVGKTVLLVRTKSMAEQQGYRALLIEAREGSRLSELLTPGLQSTLYAFSVVAEAKEQARRALRVLKSFLIGFKVRLQDLELSLSIEPEHGTADSGNLEADLPALLVAVGEAARSAGRPVVILIDELQYLSREEFSALIMSMHQINQQALPVLLVGAGLPQIPGLAGESKSYSERLFRFPQIGALLEEDARSAIEKPIRQEQADIEAEAVQAILTVSERYPYFIQQWGHDSWNVARGPVIRKADVETATEVALKALDDNFFRVRFDRCTPSEKRYLRALAGFGGGAHRSAEVANVLRVPTQSVGPVRSNLIKKGMIYAPQHGDTAFTVPLFDSYMRRAMPHLD